MANAAGLRLVFMDAFEKKEVVNINEVTVADATTRLMAEIRGYYASAK